MKLNLGCGKAIMEGAINHDLWRHHTYVDIVHDLNIRPWPWSKESFVTVYALDVLEHLYNFIKSLEECHRILIPNGRLHLRVPNAAHVVSFRDPTHHWCLTEDSMDYFIKGTWLEEKYGFYSPMRWKKLEQTVGNEIFWILEKDA